MKQTVVGVFDDHASAQSAAAKLKASGFAADSVHISMDDTAVSTTTSTTTTTSSTTESGGVMSSVKNFFSDIFGNDDDEHVGQYAEAVRRGGVLVKVDVDEDDEASIDLARDTLEDAGAMNIEERAAEWRESGWTGSTSAASTSAALQQPVTGGTLSGEETIKVVKEEVAVGKRTVGTGGVRVYARTVERPVTESLQLREEHATIQRTPVDRPATAADLQAFQDRTIEVRETAEEAVVQKTARVVEEVTVGKESSQRTETIHETVRETEVEVESLPGTTARGVSGDDSVYRSHYASEYGSLGGSYDEYEPAYQYGQSLYGDSRYTGKSWDEFEPHARSDWESKNPGSTWERVKGAVRHAWQSGKQKLS